MSSIFTKIINREIPAAIVFENDSYIAFMDAYPHMEGHLLICPKEEVDYIFDLEDDIYHGLFDIAKMLSEPLQKVTGAKRIGIVVEGFGVPHVHVHLMPMNDAITGMGELVETEELEKVANKIKAKL